MTALLLKHLTRFVLIAERNKFGTTIAALMAVVIGAMLAYLK